ncbi:uncharacterized protein EV420DRAFT_1479526 [Desarmillaria tabescens]|uniref:Uncharacterized protein n=1 Tax=Armillaria tabescens TaxID=1929756 RepID=A0AA39KCX1_ARMTA|nr:uncharacterized protein EV420DRAFT_1479526 [Desarmillaria tabescens]KAK0458856.1 hypothetical protein EV420DRAFT_1479526 [Desarmillaria tabescens]
MDMRVKKAGISQHRNGCHPASDGDSDYWAESPGCFAHIINLACKEVISAVTALNGVLFSDFVLENLDIERDPIAATRALIRVGIEKFLDKQDFAELRQYKLSDDEWKALHIIHQILVFPDANPAIKEGLCKLKTYRGCTEVVPAYTLATILNPNMKLRWYTRYMPEEEEARQLFIRTLRDYRCSATMPPTPVRPLNPTRSTWADDLLGDNLFDMTLHPQGLEAEFRATKKGKLVKANWSRAEPSGGNTSMHPSGEIGLGLERVALS